MRKRVFCFLLVVLTAAVTLFPSLSMADSDSRNGTVWGGWLILRDGPSYGANILSSYPTGTVVKINGQIGSWYKVQAPDGKNGYMYSKWLKVSGESGKGKFQPGDTVYVTSRNGLNVRLREGPATSFRVLATYAPGTQATMVSCGTNWSQIRIGKYQGFMMNSYLTKQITPDPEPTSPPSGEYDVYVTSKNGKGVNLRSGDSKSYPSIGFYSVGTKARMISYGRVWSYIRVGTRTGYMMTEFLTENEPFHPSPIVGAPVVTSANGKNVNLRSGPGKSYSVIRSFPVGTVLQIISRGSAWDYVSINGYRGYMMREFIRENGTPTPDSDTKLKSVTITPKSIPYPGLTLTAEVNSEARHETLIYEWYWDGDIRLNCTSREYVVTKADVGHELSCKVYGKIENGATLVVTSSRTEPATTTDLSPKE